MGFFWEKEVHEIYLRLLLLHNMYVVILHYQSSISLSYRTIYISLSLICLIKVTYTCLIF